jgi:tripartite-type tricarboxylate transporter receptor subunit TctC
MAVNPAANSRIPYNNFTDFIPVTKFVAVANVLAVHPSVPANTVQELIKLLKANPGKYAFASSGTAGIGHMMGELFLSASGTDMVHIPYKGAGPAVIDVIGGQVPVLFDNLPSSKPQIDAGKMRLLAVASAKRLPAYPNVPTFAEIGMPEVNDPAWYGLVAPAKTPKEIIDKLYAASVKAVNTPAIRDKLSLQGADPVANTPAEFAKDIKIEYDKMKQIVVKKGIKLD